MNVKIIQLPFIALFGLACTSETEAPDTGNGGTAGASPTGGATSGGAAGTATSGGASATGGRAGAGATAGTGGGGSAGTSTTGGGASTAGGASPGGGQAGMSAGTAGMGEGGSAGSARAGNGAGGNAAGGASSGGAGGLGGIGGGSGTAGAGGSPDLLDVASALDGVRVDDPCAGTPVIADGEVCNHVMLTNGGGFEASEEVTIGGTPGTTYDVTVRIRGIVEPTNIGGGMRPDTSTFQYSNMTWRRVPYTIGGTVQSADYSQWYINVGSPEQTLYLNDYQKTGHYIFELDYEVTIPMAANTLVTVGGTDSNERQIVNYEEYAPDGIPGSMNYGQFIQVNVVAVAPSDD